MTYFKLTLVFKVKNDWFVPYCLDMYTQDNSIIKLVYVFGIVFFLVENLFFNGHFVSVKN